MDQSEINWMSIGCLLAIHWISIGIIAPNRTPFAYQHLMENHYNPNPMSQDYEKLFSAIETPELPAGLIGQVMKCIAKERGHLVNRKRGAMLLVTATGMLAALTPVFILIKASLEESGFWQYFSLLFSDFDIVTASWQNFLASLLEALPVTGLILLFAILLSGLSLLKFVGTRNIRMA